MDKRYLHEFRCLTWEVKVDIIVMGSVCFYYSLCKYYDEEGFGGIQERLRWRYSANEFKGTDNHPCNYVQAENRNGKTSS